MSKFNMNVVQACLCCQEPQGERSIAKGRGKLEEIRVQLKEQHELLLMMSKYQTYDPSEMTKGVWETVAILATIGAAIGVATIAPELGALPEIGAGAGLDAGADLPSVLRGLQPAY